MSAGENPTAMPWRAATKPAAQNKAAPAPQATPKTTGCPIEDPEGAGLGALTEFPCADRWRDRVDPIRRLPAWAHGARAHTCSPRHRRAEFGHMKERTSWSAAGMSGARPPTAGTFADAALHAADLDHRRRPGARFHIG